MITYRSYYNYLTIIPGLSREVFPDAASRATPRDRPAATDGTRARHDNDVESKTASGDSDEKARNSMNAPRSGDAVVGQEQPSGTEVRLQAEERGNRPADAAGPTEDVLGLELWLNR